MTIKQRSNQTSKQFNCVSFNLRQTIDCKHVLLGVGDSKLVQITLAHNARYKKRTDLPSLRSFSQKIRNIRTAVPERAAMFVIVIDDDDDMTFAHLAS